MIRSLFTLLCASLLVFAPQTAPGNPEAVALSEGSPAPFAGVLVPELRLRVMLGAVHDRDQCMADLELERSLHTADNVEAAMLLHACHKARQDCEADAAEPVVVESGVPWWAVVLVGSAGIVAGVGVGLAL